MRRPLVLWSWIVLALLAAHDVTHVVDDGLETSPGQLALVAVPQWIALAVVMAFVLRGDRRAALLLGVAVVAGFALIHLLPFSAAAYWDLSPAAVSWALAWVPAVAGLVLVFLARPATRFDPAAHDRGG